MAYIEKHVEFTDDVQEDAEASKDHSQAQKLHRRDTPHHLKNKRIVKNNAESIALDVSFCDQFLVFIHFKCFLFIFL